MQIHNYLLLSAMTIDFIVDFNNTTIEWAYYYSSHQGNRSGNQDNFPHLLSGKLSHMRLHYPKHTQTFKISGSYYLNAVQKHHRN